MCCACHIAMEYNLFMVAVVISRVKGAGQPFVYLYTELHAGIADISVPQLLYVTRRRLE